MKSYKELISSTFKNTSLWNYYSDSESESISLLNIWDPKDCQAFIQKYLANSGKAGMYHSYLSQMDAMKAERMQHMVYTFLFGVYLRNLPLFKGCIDKFIKNLTRGMEEYNVKFEFVWFLICLMHDVEIVNEDTPPTFEECEEVDVTCIEYKEGAVPYHLREAYKRYFLYRSKKGKKDHGIIAGIRMHKYLCAIREQQFIDDSNSSGLPPNRLKWGKKLIDIYAVCAWVVICHNIWYRNAENAEEALDCKEYQSLEMDELVMQNGTIRKIHLRETPLLYLFDIVDSIEPIKTLKNNALLDKVYISTEGDSIRVTVADGSAKLKEYIKNVSKTNTWLTIQPSESTVDSQSVVLGIVK